MPTSGSFNPLWVRVGRGARVFWHLICGLLWVLLVFPCISAPQRRHIRYRWSCKLLQVFGFQLCIEGALPEQPGLIAANHISWIDIFAINAITPVAFVSKDDVIHWPIIGILARHNETIFLQRGSRGHAHSIGRAMVDRLRGNGWLAIFPEGTTTDGSFLHPFHAALLQPAIDAHVPVTPIAIRYEDLTGQPSTLPAYAGETTLWECVCAILSARKLVIRVTIGAPILVSNSTGSQSRKLLAQKVRNHIEQSLYL